jgi:hypothetical protein
MPEDAPRPAQAAIRTPILKGIHHLYFNSISIVTFGLPSWLIAVAWLAAPHRLALLGLAIVCLGGAGGLLLWRRRSAAAVCEVGAGSARAAITAVIVGELALGVVLTVLGFLSA